MKYLFSVLYFIFSNIALNACCAGGMFDIYPNNNWLSDTPVILVEWMEKDYQMYDKVDSANFYLMNEFGDKVKLQIIDKIYNNQTYAQIILKPQVRLREGTEVSIILENINFRENKKTDKFTRFIEEGKCWEIKKISDITKPIFTQVPKFKNNNKAFTMYSSISTIVEIEYSENIAYECVHRESKKAFMLGKITNKEGASHYVKIIDNQFNIYDGSCSRIFDLNSETKYLYKLELVDLSGNRSDEIINLEFKTAKREVLEYETFEINGIKGSRLCQ